MKTAKLTVVIVSYNVKYYTEQCLNSLEKALKGIDSQVIVVDNNSRDGSAAYLSHRFRGRGVEVIDSNHNLGFARANNLAIRQTAGEYVLLLNPDTIVGEDTVRNVLGFMDCHPKAGGVGVRMQNANGSKAPESRRGLPSPFVAFCKMAGLCSCFPKSRTFGRYYMSYLGWDEPCRIDVVSGAFFMLRREALSRVGLLDEDFFMYGEDIDLSYRLLKGGYENWYLPQPMLHYKGESTHKSSFRYVHVFYRAMLIFFRKHYGHLSFCISLPIKMAIYFKALLALVKMQCDGMRKFLAMSRNTPRAVYMFVGSQPMIDACAAISRRKGLSARYCREAGMAADMIAKLGEETDDKAMAYVVFDTSTFSYSDMLSLMAVNHRKNIQLGTYNCRNRIIITQNETIK